MDLKHIFDEKLLKYRQILKEKEIKKKTDTDSSESITENSNKATKKIITASIQEQNIKTSKHQKVINQKNRQGKVQVEKEI